MKKMNKAVLKKAFSGILMMPLLIGLCLISAAAQEAKIAPEMSVAGARLNDETSGKAFLGNFSATRDEQNRPVYYFYNEFGTEVMKLTAFSEARPHLIIAAEVYRVGESYQKKHYVLRDKSSFMTESGFFVGERQTAKSLLFAIAEITDPKELVKKKGEPTEDVKEDKKQTITYKFDEKSFPASEGAMKIAAYTAVYEFRGKRLRKFSLSVELK